MLFQPRGTGRGSEVIVQQNQSGLLVATGNPPEPQEHPACRVIRDAMAGLAEKLGEFEQTTQGVLGDRTIYSVARALARCYENPTAYEISTLSQLIHQFVEGAT